MQKFPLILLLVLVASLFAQKNSGKDIIVEKDYKNKMVKQVEDGKTIVGGYGEMIFTDESGSKPAEMEFKRFILYMDHYFNDKIAFKSELEYEEGKELTLEQAFLELALKENLAIRTGLVLVPTSRINLYHEPSYFYTVARPELEKYITPTTWREFGAGIVGSNGKGLSYEAYIIAGLNSEKFSGANSIRKGRQGAGAIENGEEPGGFAANLNNPAFSARMDYVTPVSGLQVGAAIYYGGADNREDGVETGSKVSIISLNADYQINYFRFIAAYAMNKVSNADQVNLANGLAADQGVGSTANGFNFTAAVDLAAIINPESQYNLTPFIFFEKYNKHASVPEGYVKNDAFNITRTIIGINYKPTYNVVFKADYTFKKSALDNSEIVKYFQLGIGYNF